MGKYGWMGGVGGGFLRAAVARSVGCAGDGRRVGLKWGGEALVGIVKSLGR